MKQIKIVFLSFLLVLVPVQDAHAGLLDDVFDWIKDTYYKAKSAASWAERAHNRVATKATEVANKVVSETNRAIGEVENLAGDVTNIYTDIKTLAIGIDPGDIAARVISELQNEQNCQDLPNRLDGLVGAVLGNTDFGLPDSFTEHLSVVNFSQLDLLGIDPATATGDDLYFYKVRTVKPLAAIEGVTQSFFKIPFVIGSAIANACADAAEYRIGQRDDLSSLHTRIHHALSSKGVNNIQFQLPQSHGGELEEVANVVSQALENYDSLGMYVSKNAIKAFEKGQNWYQQEQYGLSYRAYQKAYRKLGDGDGDD